ncbi:MAG: hypothetical protein WBM83_15635 [Flavobacteriaceae bacterium]
MKRYILFFVLCCLFGTVRSQIEWGPDKAKHLAAGVVIGSLGGYAAHKVFKGDKTWMWVGAVGSSLVAGLAKEAYDQYDYGVWDNGDVLFTTLGGIVSGVALNLLLKKSRRRYHTNVMGSSSYVIQIQYALPFDVLENGSRDVVSNLQAQAILRNLY